MEKSECPFCHKIGSVFPCECQTDISTDDLTDLDMETDKLI